MDLTFNWTSDFTTLTNTPILKSIITIEQYNDFKSQVDNYCNGHYGIHKITYCADTSYDGDSGTSCGTNDSSTGYSSVRGYYKA